METKRHIYNIRIITLLLLMMIGWGSVGAEEVKYTVSSKTSVTTTGTAPTGSSAMYSQTYDTKCQMTRGNSTTLSLTGYAGKTISGIVLSMKSNQSSGEGKLSVMAGSTQLAYISNNWDKWYNNTAYSTSYKDITVSLTKSDYVIKANEDVVIKIECTTSSLYIESYTLHYYGTETNSLSSISISGDLTKSTYTVGDDFDFSGLTATGTYSNDSTANITDRAAWTVTPVTLTAETKSVSVTASYSGVSCSKDYDVTVNKKESSIEIPNMTITLNDSNIPISVTATPSDAVLSYQITDGEDYITLTNGKVTAKAAGIATIKAFYAGNDEYAAAETTFTVSVKDPAAEGYEMVDFASVYSSLKADYESVDSYRGASFNMTFSKNTGSYAPRFYRSNQSVHCYEGNTITLTSSEIVQNIKVNYLEGKASITGIGTNTITFTFDKLCYFTSITVYYSSLTIPIAAACTDGTRCYSTYSSSKAFFVPENLTVSEIGITDGRLNVQPYATGAVVPANTGVMVSATEGGNYSVAIASDATDATSVLGSNNCLKATGDSGISADQMNSGTASGTLFYRLTMHNGTQIGYWWGAENGAAFAIAANKAYLVVPQSANVKTSMWFDSDVTSISPLLTNLPGNATFNLSGQRITDTSKKGIYIMNGKKYVAK